MNNLTCVYAKRIRDKDTKASLVNFSFLVWFWVGLSYRVRHNILRHEHETSKHEHDTKSYRVSFSKHEPDNKQVTRTRPIKT
ncbi:hypothetical protein Hanom_Chr16g01512271 [Helianthus anomalus]